MTTLQKLGDKSVTEGVSRIQTRLDPDLHDSLMTIPCTVCVFIN